MDNDLKNKTLLFSYESSYNMFWSYTMNFETAPHHGFIKLKNKESIFICTLLLGAFHVMLY